jgi:hypothetical protein
MCPLAALKHLVGDEVERAHWRGGVREKRRELKGLWTHLSSSLEDCRTN